MDLPLAFVAAASLCIQPLDRLDAEAPEGCDVEARTMAPATFARLTGIAVAPNAEIRVDFDDNCETDEGDVLAWARSSDAQPFLERRDLRLFELIVERHFEAIGWDEVVPGDVNADDVVDHADLVELVMQLGRRMEYPPSLAVDLNGDGEVDAEDVARLLDQWGEESEDGLTHISISYKCGFEFKPLPPEPAEEVVEQ